jgi:hypothetical protein
VNNSNELDNIFDDCLESLLIKSETVEQCQATYLAQAVYLNHRLTR